MSGFLSGSRCRLCVCVDRGFGGGWVSVIFVTYSLSFIIGCK